MQPTYRILVVTLAVALPLKLAVAQAGVNSGGIRPTVAAPQERARPVPPPALPGSRAEPNIVAPATRPGTDMPPTEALFDAINRGDVTAARDAVSRGADLNGQNVLGLTPLELSVDLGRNDLSFLLLSLRGPSSSAVPLEAAAPPRAPTASERRAAAQEERTARARQRTPAAPASSPQAPRLFAGDGGTPIPQSGFLGFDSAR